MFLRHARAARLAAAYLLFTVAVVMVPKADIPETPFDEANTPTNEMAVEKTASPSECGQSPPSLVLRIFAQPRSITVRRILPVYAGRLTDSHASETLLLSPLLTHSRDTAALFWIVLPPVRRCRPTGPRGCNDASTTRCQARALIKQSKTDSP